MYFKKMENKPGCEYLCTNSQGKFVAAATRDRDGKWTVATGKEEAPEVLQDNLSMEEAFDFILKLQ